MNNIIIFGAQYLIYFEIAIFVVYFFLQPKNKKQDLIILSVIYLPITYIFAKIVSFLYFDPRPFVVGNFTPLIPHLADNGFPSDHMLLTSAIASVLFMYNKKIGIIAWVLAVIIGTSRVLAGIHHPIDIIGSAVISVGIMLVVKRYFIPKISKI